MNWQKASGYDRRSKVEAAISRYKRVIGEALRSREDARRVSGRQNRGQGAPWNSDVLSACASHDIRCSGQSSLRSIHATKPRVLHA
jgi:hypothetical protein